MTPEIWIAIIAAVAALASAGIANRGRQHSKAARVQVENSHTSNLREESDDRHIEIMAAISDVKQDQAGMKSDIRGIRRDLGRHSDQLRDLERTQPRPKDPGRR